MGCGAAGGPVTSSDVAAILDLTKIENLTCKSKEEVNNKGDVRLAMYN